MQLLVPNLIKEKSSFNFNNLFINNYGQNKDLNAFQIYLLY